MPRRYELTDEQFAMIADLLPATGRPGGQWNDHRTTLDGVFWALHTGAQWRELPERYGKWKSVYDRFNRWARDGTIARILERLQMRLDARGRIDFDLWLVDGSSIRASRSAAGAGGKKGRGGARRPRPRPLARRVRDEAPPGHRLARRPALGRRHGGPGPRVEVAGARPGGGAAEAAGAGPAPPPPAAAGRGQGVQLPPGPPLLEAARDQGGHPDAQGPEAEPAVRQGGLQAPQRHRAVHRLDQGESPGGDAVREARRELPGDGQAGHDPSMLSHA